MGFALPKASSDHGLAFHTKVSRQFLELRVLHKTSLAPTYREQKPTLVERQSSGILGGHWLRAEEFQRRRGHVPPGRHMAVFFKISNLFDLILSPFIKKKKERTEIAGILAYVRVGDKGAT